MSVQRESENISSNTSALRTENSGRKTIHSQVKDYAVEIIEPEKIKNITQERGARIREEIIGRILVMVFLLLLIAFSYFSLV